MNKICNNCIHADYTEGQKGWASDNKTSIDNTSLKYCYGRINDYVAKNHHCKEFSPKPKPT